MKGISYLLALVVLAGAAAGCSGGSDPVGPSNSMSLHQGAVQPPNVSHSGATTTLEFGTVAGDQTLQAGLQGTAVGGTGDPDCDGGPGLGASGDIHSSCTPAN
jgi:hypothetical protein